MTTKTDNAARRPPARLTLFGFPPTDADVVVAARTPAWRWTRALLSFGIGIGVAPVAALLPPHLPWALVCIVTGTVLAVRRLTERVTLRSLRGRCPSCGEPQALDEPRKLARPHALSCTGCGHELLLEVDMGGAPANGG